MKLIIPLGNTLKSDADEFSHLGAVFAYENEEEVEKAIIRLSKDGFKRFLLLEGKIIEVKTLKECIAEREGADDRI